MPQLYHHPFCPHSRFVRLALAEYGVEDGLVEERVGAAARIPAARSRGRDAGAGRGDGPVVPGADVIAEYLDETRGARLGDRRLLPEDPLGRVEVRRLMRWFNVKFYAEASQLAGDREDLQALHEFSRRRRRAGHGRDARGARQSALSSALHRLSRRRRAIGSPATS